MSNEDNTLEALRDYVLSAGKNVSIKQVAKIVGCEADDQETLDSWSERLVAAYPECDPAKATEKTPTPPKKPAAVEPQYKLIKDGLLLDLDVVKVGNTIVLKQREPEKPDLVNITIKGKPSLVDVTALKKLPGSTTVEPSGLTASTLLMLAEAAR